MWATILSLFKVLILFINLWNEKDIKKAEAQAEVAKEVIDAFKQTDPKVKASRLVAATNNANQLHN